MPKAHPECQASDLVDSTRPFLPRILRRLVYDIRYHGISWTLDRVVHRYRAVPRRSARSDSTGRPGGPLGLRAGEMARVKSHDEIRATLDASGAHRGLMFQPEMADFCGGVFRVHGRVERIYLEESRLTHRVRDTVMLDGVYCEGRRVQCDRSCFLFWREVWLERAAPD